jgi:hypothetical protein
VGKRHGAAMTPTRELWLTNAHLLLMSMWGALFIFGLLIPRGGTTPDLTQVKSRVTRPLGTKAPGYKERQTRGNAISKRGGLCICLRALIQLCRAGVE